MMMMALPGVLDSGWSIAAQMEFAVNYSLEAMELVSRSEIRVDRIKCADWPDMIAEASRTQKVYVHFPFDVGSAWGGRRIWIAPKP